MQVLYRNLMVNANQKPVIDNAKNKEKGIKVYHLRKPTNYERRVQEKKQRCTKITIKVTK